MITIISGTNRSGSNSLKIAKLYEEQLNGKSVSCQILSLEEHDMSLQSDAFKKLEKQFLVDAKSFIIIMPEYNGSYPGILKLMIDNTDVAACWYHKKVLLVGVSTGRAGNLRGMEHLTGSLLHLKMLVHHNRLPISVVHSLFNEAGAPNDLLSMLVEKHVEEFLLF